MLSVSLPPFLRFPSPVSFPPPSSASFPSPFASRPTSPALLALQCPPSAVAQRVALSRLLVHLSNCLSVVTWRGWGGQHRPLLDGQHPLWSPWEPSVSLRSWCLPERVPSCTGAGSLRPGQTDRCSGERAETTGPSMWSLLPPHAGLLSKPQPWNRDFSLGQSHFLESYFFSSDFRSDTFSF